MIYILDFFIYDFLKMKVTLAIELYLDLESLIAY
jgi:hypothetical protein